MKELRHIPPDGDAVHGGRRSRRPVLQQMAEYAVSVGVHGFFALGSQGRAPRCRRFSASAPARSWSRPVRGRVPIVLHVGTVDTQTTLDLARHAEQIGADAVAVVPPFYYDHDEYEIIAHYRAVARAVDLPIFIYNNPRYSRIQIGPPLAKKIVGELPSVVAMKDSYGSLDDLLAYSAPPTLQLSSSFPGPSPRARSALRRSRRHQPAGRHVPRPLRAPLRGCEGPPVRRGATAPGSGARRHRRARPLQQAGGSRRYARPCASRASP